MDKFASASPLLGVRVWLSGSVPTDANEFQEKRLLIFVADFARTVFRAGGHILHGGHPSFVPTLLEVAQQHITNGGRKDWLTLAVSRAYSKHPDLVPINHWRSICTVYETPESTDDGEGIAKSLGILRSWIVERCDAFVGAGGMWWKEVPSRAGVPAETKLALDRRIPCFLLGGLGGAAETFVKGRPDIFRSMSNGLSRVANEALALREDIDGLVDTISEQLALLPLVRGRVDDGASFRILALDGGGIKGAYSASALATLENALKCKVSDYFDLIAGTSTGGIIAVGLGAGLTAHELLDFYKDRGKVIFPITSFHRKWWRKLRHVAVPKFSQEVLLRELECALNAGGKTSAGGSKTLADSQCRLVIPAYDAVSGACHIFRTPHHPLLTRDETALLAEVALATAAAPTYFASAKVRNMIANSSYVDGGVWANSPIMAAIVEAVFYLGVPLGRIDILSIGTTEEPFAINKFSHSGLAGWRQNLLYLFANTQVETSLDHAKKFVGDPRFLRINTITKPGLYALDGSRKIEELISLGNKAASDISILSQVKSRFLNDVKALPWK
jgi:predicted acylesterase/phospholipase RssA